MNGTRADAVHPRAPLCKGSCREATEGLCGTVLQFRKCFGEKAYGNDFAVESSYFNDASAKRGQNGHCSFGRWAHREVHHYNPSVSYADSSPYTGEPLARTASGRKPLPKQPYKFPIYLTAYKTRQPGFSYSRLSFPSIRYLFSAPPYRRMLRQQYSHSMAMATAYTEP